MLEAVRPPSAWAVGLGVAPSSGRRIVAASCRSGADRDRRRGGPGGLRLPRPGSPRRIRTSSRSGSRGLALPGAASMRSRRPHPRCWNPYEMAGYRFGGRSPGRSKRLYLAPMAQLFSTLSPAVAMRGLPSSVNPLLAGLGLYWVPARVGAGSVPCGMAYRRRAVSLAMLMSTSEMSPCRCPSRGCGRRTTVALIGAAGLSAGRPLVSQDRAARRGALVDRCRGHRPPESRPGDIARSSSSLYPCRDPSPAIRARASAWRGWAAAGGVALFTSQIAAAREPRGAAAADRRAAGVEAWPAGYDRLGDALRMPLGGADSAPRSGQPGVWAAWPLAVGRRTRAPMRGAVMRRSPCPSRCDDAAAFRALVWGVGGALVLTWVAMLERRRHRRVVPLLAPGGSPSATCLPATRGACATWRSSRSDPRRGRGCGPAGRPGCRPVALRCALGGGCVRAWLGVAAGGQVPPRYGSRCLAAGLVCGRRRRSRLLVTSQGRHRAGRVRRRSAVLFSAEHRPSASRGSHSVTTADTILPRPEGALSEPSQPIHWQPPRPPGWTPQPSWRRRPFVPRLQASDERYHSWARPPRGLRQGAICSCGSAPTGRRWRWNAATIALDPRTRSATAVPAPRYWDCLRARTDLPVFYNAAVIDLPTSQDAGLLGVRYLAMPHRHRVAAGGDGRRTGAGLRPRSGARRGSPTSLAGDPRADRGGPRPPPQPCRPSRPRLRSCQRGQVLDPTPAPAGARCAQTFQERQSAQGAQRVAALTIETPQRLRAVDASSCQLLRRRLDRHGRRI